MKKNKDLSFLDALAEFGKSVGLISLGIPPWKEKEPEPAVEPKDWKFEIRVVHFLHSDYTVEYRIKKRFWGKWTQFKRSFVIGWVTSDSTIHYNPVLGSTHEMEEFARRFNSIEDIYKYNQEESAKYDSLYEERARLRIQERPYTSKVIKSAEHDEE